VTKESAGKEVVVGIEVVVVVDDDDNDDGVVEAVEEDKTDEDKGREGWRGGREAADEEARGIGEAGIANEEDDDEERGAGEEGISVEERTRGVGEGRCEGEGDGRGTVCRRCFLSTSCSSSSSS